MSTLDLSVILITRNEAANIAACLESVAFADEWIVVDAGSTDGTVEIAQRLGAKVEVTVDWPGFGAQKNRALARATGRWVFSIDADERVTPELGASIRAAVAANDPAITGYEISRLSNFCGQWMRHGDWYPDRVLRLFRREAGRFSADRVHERLDVEGRVARIGAKAGELLHYSMPDLHGAIDKLNRYSSGRAADKVAAGARGGVWAAVTHGFWAFLRCYMLRRGFLDGRLGLVLAIYVAENSYYRYLKMGLAAPSIEASPARPSPGTPHQ